MKVLNTISLLLIGAGLLLTPTTSLAKKKDKKEEPKTIAITPAIDIKTSPVKDQASSGTCWSYATTSFVETELLRMGKEEFDLSEVYFVRNAYEHKALKYLRVHGKGNFSQGGQAHDVMNSINEVGFVTEEDYDGLKYGYDYHHHYEMAKVMEGILDNSMEGKKYYTGMALKVINATLDLYLGEINDELKAKGKKLVETTGFNTSDYIELTSYQMYPMYTKVDLEVPDNWSHDDYYNVPLTDLMKVINNAFENGYSVCWDGDVSDKGFSHRHGVAILPEANIEDMPESEQSKWDGFSKADMYSFTKPVPEKNVTDELRQKEFDLYKSTDDHLMHLVGTGKDVNGTIYYKTKNSWAEDSNEFGGNLYMSESYVKLHTVAIMIHKDAIPTDIKTKLGL